VRNQRVVLISGVLVLGLLAVLLFAAINSVFSESANIVPEADTNGFCQKLITTTNESQPTWQVATSQLPATTASIKIGTWWHWGEPKMLISVSGKAVVVEIQPSFGGSKPKSLFFAHSGRMRLDYEVTKPLCLAVYQVNQGLIATQPLFLRYEPLPEELIPLTPEPIIMATRPRQ
jgi:hypothetical protein